MFKKKPSLESCLGGPLSFYSGEVTLRFAKDPYHKYFLLAAQGELIPVDGVTSACGVLDKSVFLIPWACKVMANKLLQTMPKVKDELGIEYNDSILWTEFEKLVLDAKKAHKERLTDAADVGAAAHMWLEKSIQYAIEHTDGIVKKLHEELPSDERAINCGHAAFDWMHLHSVQWISTEKVVYSRKHNYAGTMDGKAYVDGILSIVDWKSSNALRTDYLMQTAAYLKADFEENNIVIPDRWILRLGKEDGNFEPWHLESDTIEEDFRAFVLCLTIEREYAKLNERVKHAKK